MYRMMSVFLVAAATLFGVSILSSARDNPKSYPITLKADDVHEFAELSVELNGLTLTGKNVVAIPIRCEVGITGAMLLGTGDFRFTPADGQEIKGVFRAAMLRFDPADQPKLLPLEQTKTMTDLAAREMSQHLLNNVFRHCWHSGNEALIPEAGSFVANVYSQTHGDLLISTGPKGNVAHNFTTRETIYEKK